MTYPDKTLLVDALVEVARRAMMASRAEHPEDLGIEGSNAIEHAAVTLNVLHQRGAL